MKENLAPLDKQVSSSQYKIRFGYTVLKHIRVSENIVLVVVYAYFQVSAGYVASVNIVICFTVARYTVLSFDA